MAAGAILAGPVPVGEATAEADAFEGGVFQFKNRREGRKIRRRAVNDIVSEARNQGCSSKDCRRLRLYFYTEEGADYLQDEIGDFLVEKQGFSASVAGAVTYGAFNWEAFLETVLAILEVILPFILSLL